VVEVVVIVPAAMLLFLLVVQMALWAHAGTLVQAAASQGDEAACLYGSSASEGLEEADDALNATAAAVVMNRSVTVRKLPGDLIEVQVQGTAESIIPWLHLPVSATQVGVQQQFQAND
jgi:hypothetical protein